MICSDEMYCLFNTETNSYYNHPSFEWSVLYGDGLTFTSDIDKLSIFDKQNTQLMLALMLNTGITSIIIKNARTLKQVYLEDDPLVTTTVHFVRKMLEKQSIPYRLEYYQLILKLILNLHKNYRYFVIYKDSIDNQLSDRLMIFSDQKYGIYVKKLKSIEQIIYAKLKYDVLLCCDTDTKQFNV